MCCSRPTWTKQPSKYQSKTGAPSTEGVCRRGAAVYGLLELVMISGYDPMSWHKNICLLGRNGAGNTSLRRNQRKSLENLCSFGLCCITQNYCSILIEGYEKSLYITCNFTKGFLAIEAGFAFMQKLTPSRYVPYRNHKIDPDFTMAS